MRNIGDDGSTGATPVLDGSPADQEAGGYAVVVPWVDEAQIISFLDAWRVPHTIPDWLILQHDEHREGCAVTKNRGVEQAVARGADLVVVLDDDCYPAEVESLEDHVSLHRRALDPQEVEMFEIVTSPPSRGTPYGDLTVRMPVAASTGFWTEIGDYDAARQLVYQARPMIFNRKAVHGRWFPLCGMNLAFRPTEWDPWCRFIDVPRFDDIWMGWIWQKEAYRRGFCFNLNGPLVRHARQSDPWRNLRVEAEYLEASELLWREIVLSPEEDYDKLCGLLPPHRGGSDR